MDKKNRESDRPLMGDKNYKGPSLVDLAKTKSLRVGL